MPSTINGIGTHYYGKKNHTARTARCSSCDRLANLESYDTRLWFVVVFLPVIPLGRKRILDQCPACSRHYVMKAEAYEQAKQAQTSASLEQYHGEPTVEAAIRTHAQLLAFHEYDQAADFRPTALAHFPDHAGLRATMAAHLREMSAFEESAELFQEAFDLDPELPEARVGVARQKMAEGELDEARELLDFLMEPGEGRRSSLVPIDLLAGYLQRAGRHEEALEIAEVLLRELPQMETNHVFRSFVRRSEKALGRPDSILPERGFSIAALFRSEGSPYAPWQRKLAIGGAAAAVVLGGMSLSNEYIRRNRTIHVVNATGQPAQVRVDDQPAVTVSGMGRLSVAEGPHVLKVSGPVNESHNITVESGYFDRWFSKPAWVLNPGGEAVLEDVTHVYSANGTPGHRDLVVGESVVYRPHVDYLFTPAPDQIKVKNKGQEVTKTQVDWVQGDDLTAFMNTIETNRASAMAFAEKRLRRTPNQSGLLKYYVGASTEGERGRIEAFLKSGLGRRPVDIPWHRAYQTVAELANQEAELVALYDKALAAEPTNAALLYLRGRVEADWDRQDGYYRRAIEADAKLGWPWMAIAARADSAGRWDDCQNAAIKARELGVDEPERLVDLIHEARMAKGEAAALVEEYRAGRNANSQDVSSILLLLDALAASGREGEIDSAITVWVQRLPIQVQGQAAAYLRTMGQYDAGKLAECAEFCKANGLLKSTPVHFQAVIALGRIAEATDEAVFGLALADPLNMLALSVALGLDGKPEDAARWREKSVGALKKGGILSDIAKGTRLLAASEPPTIEEVGRVYLPPASKAVILAALADQFPSGRETYLAEAAKFNISRKPAYHLVRRAIEAKSAGRP